MGRVVVVAPNAQSRAAHGLLRLVDRAPKGEGLVLRVLLDSGSGRSGLRYEEAQIVAELVRVLGVVRG